MTEATGVSKLGLLACEEGCDPIEDRLRASLRSTIEAVFDEELDAFLGRLRYSRAQGEVKGYRHGRRERQLTPTLGTQRVSVPRARLQDGSSPQQRMALQGAGSLPTSYPAGGGVDRLGLPGRRQYAAGEEGVIHTLPRSGQQRRGEPCLAQGAGGLGGMAPPQPGRGRRRPSAGGGHGG